MQTTLAGYLNDIYESIQDGIRKFWSRIEMTLSAIIVFSVVCFWIITLGAFL